jgi:hypothetical protein
MEVLVSKEQPAQLVKMELLADKDQLVQLVQLV